MSSGLQLYLFTKPFVFFLKGLFALSPSIFESPCKEILGCPWSSQSSSHCWKSKHPLLPHKAIRLCSACHEVLLTRQMQGCMPSAAYCRKCTISPLLNSRSVAGRKLIFQNLPLHHAQKSLFGIRRSYGECALCFKTNHASWGFSGISAFKTRHVHHTCIYTHCWFWMV